VSSRIRNSPCTDLTCSAQRYQAVSPFLRLPAELRNTIYDLVLDLPSNGLLHHDHNTWDRLNFSRTCHQIFIETAEPYFTTKILALSNVILINTADRKPASQFVSLLTPSQNIAIRGIACRERDFPKVWRNLDQLYSVQKLIFVGIPGNQMLRCQT
jgi:hypothetical protein